MNKNIVKIYLALAAISGAGATGFRFEPPVRVINNGTYGSAPLIRGIEGKVASASSDAGEFDLRLYRKKLGGVEGLDKRIAGFLNNQEIVQVIEDALGEDSLESILFRMQIKEVKLFVKLGINNLPLARNSPKNHLCAYKKITTEAFRQITAIYENGEYRKIYAHFFDGEHEISCFLVVKINGELVWHDNLDRKVGALSLQPSNVLTAVNCAGVAKLSRQTQTDIIRKYWQLSNSIKLKKSRHKSIYGTSPDPDNPNVIKLASVPYETSRFNVNLVMPKDIEQITKILALSEKHPLRARYPEFFKRAQKRLDDMLRIQERRFLEGVRALMGQGHDYELAKKYSELVRAMEGALMSEEDRL